MISSKNLISKVFLVVFLISNVAADYKIGVGIADCTGPPAEIIFVSRNHFKKQPTQATLDVWDLLF